MSKDRDFGSITGRDFMDELWRYRRGSVTRRHFLGVTGLGIATAVLASAVPVLRPRPALAQGELGDTLNFTTWPNYFAQENLDKFTADTGVNINVTVFGSNEEMLAKLQAGGTGWDVFVPTNYTISTYKGLDLIDPLDFSKLKNFDESTHEARFIGEAKIDGKLWAVPKNWGTTGYVVNTGKVQGDMTTWKEFWDRTRDDLSGRVMVHDYQLTTIGNALKYFGYSFNSVDPKELGEAEKLLIEAKPHLFAINSDYQPSIRNGDAWASVAWTGDATQLSRDMPEIRYVLGKEGGEIWTDFYAIPKEAANKPAAYSFIDYMISPEVNAREVQAHGYPSTDSRTNALVPKDMLENPILYPAAELLSELEFGAAATLTDPLRAEIMARFKSAKLPIAVEHGKVPGRSRLVTALLVAPAAVFFALLLVLPLVVVVIYSFGERAPAGGYAPGFTVANYLNLPARSTAFLNTLTLAPVGTLLCALFAYPLAYYLAVKTSPRWRMLLLVLVIVPFWTSQLLRIYAWLLILGNQGLPRFLSLLGFEDLRIVNTPAAVLIGMVYGYLPLMVLPIYVSLEKFDLRLLEASSDLGANPWRSFVQVTLPMSLPGVATGSMLVFILLMGEFIIPALLGGGKVFFIGNALVDLFLQSRNWPYGAAVSVALVAVMLVTVVVYMRFVLGPSGGRRVALA